MGFFINRSSGESTTEQSGTSSSTPWAPQARQLRFGFKEARKLYGQPIQYFPQGTVASQSGATQSAQQLRLQRAMGGSDLTRAAQQQILGETRGDYLGGNPYLDAIYARGADQATSAFNRGVLPSLEARFAKSGRLGSPEYQAARSDAYGNLSSELAGSANELYGGAYEADRNRQAAAARFAPALALMDYADIDQASQVGAERDVRNQRLLDAQIKRHDFEQMEPWQRLALFNSGIGSPIAGTTNWSSTSNTDSSGVNFGLQPKNSPEQPATWERVLGMVFSAL